MMTQEQYLADRQQAADLLQVEPESCDRFELVDPFNPQNTVLGYLTHRSDYRYGALAILAVNGRATPQVILGTPKLHYPFAKDLAHNERLYHWPKVVAARSYPKWDGTNVIMFSYADADGNRFVSYKLRLSPFVRNGKYGRFLDYWNRLMVEQKITPPDEVLHGQLALGFEMYGYENLITVRYPFPLRATLLFGVRQVSGAAVIPELCPESLSHLWNNMNYECHSFSPEGLTRFYEMVRACDSVACCITETEAGERSVTGTEGSVMYLLLDVKGVPRWQMVKIKPEAIEAIHWASSTINYRTILPTVWNALETVELEAVTPELIAKMLLEEFDQTRVDEAASMIPAAIAEVTRAVHFRDNLRTRFAEVPDRSSKRSILRFMSQFFPREDMKRVYTGLVQAGMISPELK